MYTAILRTLIIQKQSLGGVAVGSSWMDESWDDVFSYTDGQTIQGGQVVFAVDVEQIVNRYGGPPAPIEPDPDTQPGSTWPTVEQVNVDVEVKDDSEGN